MAIFPQYGSYPYQQIYPTQSANNPQPTQMSPAQPSNGIIWVQGEAGAKSYIVPPGSTTQLWDSESQVIYLKTADAYGIPSMKILDYTIRDGAPTEGNILATDGFATQDDINALRKQIDALNRKFKALAKEDKSNE